jgi:hypothetical protein
LTSFVAPLHAWNVVKHFISRQVRFLVAKTIEESLLHLSQLFFGDHTNKFSLSKSRHDWLWNKTPCQKENVNCFSVYFYLSLDPSKKKKTK